MCGIVGYVGDKACEKIAAVLMFTKLGFLPVSELPIPTTEPNTSKHAFLLSLKG